MPARATGGLFWLTSAFASSISAWWSFVRGALWSSRLARKDACVCLSRIRGASRAQEISTSLRPVARADVITAGNYCEKLISNRGICQEKTKVSVVLLNPHWQRKCSLRRLWLCRRQEWRRSMICRHQDQTDKSQGCGYVGQEILHKNQMDRRAGRWVHPPNMDASGAEGR